MSKPKKWIEVYPQGTKEGDEEQRFFISLARNPKYEFRSVEALAKESKLLPARVEQIIAKYYKRNMIIQNPKNEEQWAYWERVPHLLPPENISAGNQDKKRRIDKAMDFIVNPEELLDGNYNWT